MELLTSNIRRTHCPGAVGGPVPQLSRHRSAVGAQGIEDRGRCPRLPLPVAATAARSVLDEEHGHSSSCTIRS